MESGDFESNDKSYFSWDEIPGNDNVRLIDFLNRRFKIDWVKSAKIEKIDGGRTIKVYEKRRYVSLSLNDEKTKVKLKIGDGRTYELIVKAENNKLNIYDKSTFKKVADGILEGLFTIIALIFIVSVLFITIPIATAIAALIPGSGMLSFIAVIFVYAICMILIPAFICGAIFGLIFGLITGIIWIIKETIVIVLGYKSKS